MRVVQLAAALLLTAGVARADRPVLAGEATFGKPNGAILVHYATTGADAVLPTDADGDGVPDFAVQVANEAETALQHFVALGFDPPRSDGTLGGDGRIDIYLRDLTSADGNAGIDSCIGERCAGFIQAENDFAGYSYATITEGIRSVVPHELFHLVQDGYSNQQPATWTEGTAVWSVEDLYGSGNSDFERFLPAFLTKPARPFERPPAGFDNYPYGASLWPYFLEQRFGVGVIVAAWKACADATFLDAIDVALAPMHTTSDAAFVEMTRWNLYTGSRAAGGPYPDASLWPEVPLEPALEAFASAKVYLEGLSARYVPITLEVRQQLTIRPGTLQLEAWVLPQGATVDRGLLVQATTTAGDPPSLQLGPGSYTLVLTGLSRNTITTPVDVALDVPVTDPPTDDDDDGGCRSTRSPNASLIAIVLAFMATAWLTRRPATRS